MLFSPMLKVTIELLLIEKVMVYSHLLMDNTGV